MKSTHAHQDKTNISAWQTNTRKIKFTSNEIKILWKHSADGKTKFQMTTIVYCTISFSYNLPTKVLHFCYQNYHTCVVHERNSIIYFNVYTVPQDNNFSAILNNF